MTALSVSQIYGGADFCSLTTEAVLLVYKLEISLLYPLEEANDLSYSNSNTHSPSECNP